MVDSTSSLILHNNDRVVKLYKVVVNIFLIQGEGVTLAILDHVINDSIQVVVFDLILLKI